MWWGRGKAVLLGLLLAACGGRAKSSSTDEEDPRPSLVAIECGARHLCALDAKGGIHCWGAETVDSAPKESGFVSLAVGFSYSCAISQAGAVKCWGGAGYAGDPFPDHFQFHEPEGTGFSHVVIAQDNVYNTSCAWSDDGEATCWGGANVEYVIPSGLGRLSTMAANVIGVCALDVAGVVSCQPCEGCQFDTLVLDEWLPLEEPGGHKDLSMSQSVACALTSDGLLKCFGGQERAEQIETELGMQSGLVSVQMSGGGACVEQASGELRCMGGNSRLGIDGESRLVTNGFVDPLKRPFLDWCIYGGQIRPYGCVLRDGDVIECWGGIPESFPSEFHGDFYSCKLTDTAVECSGERPDHLGDDYWDDTPLR